MLENHERVEIYVLGDNFWYTRAILKQFLWKAGKVDARVARWALYVYLNGILINAKFMLRARSALMWGMIMRTLIESRFVEYLRTAVMELPAFDPSSIDEWIFQSPTQKSDDAIEYLYSIINVHNSRPCLYARVSVAIIGLGWNEK